MGVSRYPSAASTAPIIGKNIYDPVVLADMNPSASLTLVDVDASLMAVSFIVPASGNVLFDLSAASAVTAGQGAWGLKVGAAIVAKTYEVHVRDSNTRRYSCQIPVFGLAAGTAVTYRWAHACPAGGGTIHTYAGGSDNATFLAGPAIMTVRAI